jgi:hypothetical protein
MAAYGDDGLTEMGCASESIYSGDPGVDRSMLISHLVSHIISSPLIIQ